MLTNELLSAGRERLLIVHDVNNLSGYLRRRYPQFDISVSATYLEGIAELSRRPARGLLVGIDPTARKLKEAIGGLRVAAGADSPLLLCCTPSGEPTARTVLSAGANDYIICPPMGIELDRALGLHVEEPVSEPTESETALPTWEEISDLATVLAEMGGSRLTMLEKLCGMIAKSLRSGHVRLIVGRDSFTLGSEEVEPALIEPITAGGKTHGKILVGPRERQPYGVGEVEKLRHYSRLIAHLLDAAEQQQQWHALAMVDEATELPNRRYLMQALGQILHRAGHERFSVTVLIFDLDGFKHFNDTYGHAAGDEVLRETSQLFRRTCRTQDIVARYAGDEFVVVFWEPQGPRVTGSKHPTDILSVLRRFKKALQTHEFPKLGPEATGRITISGGLATFPWDGKTPEELIEKADQALLRAKRDGKNRIYLIGAEGRSIEEPKKHNQPG